MRVRVRVRVGVRVRVRVRVRAPRLARGRLHAVATARGDLATLRPEG